MKLEIKMHLSVISTTLGTSVDTLCEKFKEESKKIDEKQSKLIFEKNQAILRKWIALDVMKAEILEYEKFLITNYLESGIPIQISAFFLSKIELFLIYSRSILDILSHNLGIILLRKEYQSINDLRKNSKIPSWLNIYFKDNTKYNSEQPQKKNGWLTNLVTCNKNEYRSLRDFVAHRGGIDFIFSQNLDSSYYIILKPRINDDFSYAVEDLLNNIIQGLESFFILINDHLVV